MELGGGQQRLPGPPPAQEGPAQLPLQAARALLAEHGWSLLLGLAALGLLLRRLLARRLRGAPPHAAHADAEPDAVVRQQEAMLAARLRMQETLNAQAEKFKEKQRKLEEEKRRQKIAMWESMKEGKSYKESLQQNQQERERSTSTAAPKPKSNRKPLRGDGYNPLSGEGGGTCSWRPGRRGPSSGG